MTSAKKIFIFLCKSVYPPGKGTAKCSYPVTPGMDLQKLSLFFYTLRDSCWYSYDHHEVFWLVVFPPLHFPSFQVEPPIHLLELFKKVVSFKLLTFFGGIPKLESANIFKASLIRALLMSHHQVRHHSY